MLLSPCRGNSQPRVLALLAMLCILAVFVPSFFMTGRAARESGSCRCRWPLMIASYILSSTFVPVLSTWLMKHHVAHTPTAEPRTKVGRWIRSVGNLLTFNFYRDRYAEVLGGVVWFRWLVIPAYFAVSLLLIVFFGNRLGVEIFPQIDAGEFACGCERPMERTSTRPNKFPSPCWSTSSRKSGRRTSASRWVTSA